MNKQEALKLVEQMGEYECFVDESISKKSVLNIISKIDEPQKVVVPKFIDSFIKYTKAEGMSLFNAMDNAQKYTKNLHQKSTNLHQNEQSEWLIKHEDTFARAWLDGYEVEKEKLYTVEIPDPNSMYKHRFLSRNDNGVCIGVCMDASNGNDWKQRRENRLTEAEIKQDFEWAWQWAEPVEEEYS